MAKRKKLTIEEEVRINDRAMQVLADKTKVKVSDWIKSACETLNFDLHFFSGDIPMIAYSRTALEWLFPKDNLKYDKFITAIYVLYIRQSYEETAEGTRKLIYSNLNRDLTDEESRIYDEIMTTSELIKIPEYVFEIKPYAKTLQEDADARNVAVMLLTGIYSLSLLHQDATTLSMANEILTSIKKKKH